MSTGKAEQIRLQELQDCGLGKHADVMHTLDAIKEQLSPKEGQHLSLEQQIQLFRTLNESLDALPIEQRIKVMGVPDRAHERLVVGIKLPHKDLVNYFEQQDQHPNRPDPLGAKSFMGLLNHHGVLEVGLGGPKDKHPETWLTLEKPFYHRGIRVSTGLNQRLRKAIDRALWGNEHVLLNPELSAAFLAIDTKRQDYLTELGLIVMHDSHGQIELFVPNIEQNQDPRSHFERTLYRLAQSVEARLQRDRRPLRLRADNESEKERKVFALIQSEMLVHNPRFLELLEDRHINFYLQHHSNNDISEVIFFFKGMELSALNRPVTRADFPMGLWEVVIQTKNFGDQPVPNRPDFCMFLAIPEVADFLRTQGISFVAPTLSKDGTFSEQAYFYAENLMNFDPKRLPLVDKTMPELPSRLKEIGVPRMIPSHRRGRFS